MNNFETECKKICEDLYVNLGKFENKSNHSAGTKARKNAQELKKLLQSLREDILNLQKERRDQKQSTKGDDKEEHDEAPEQPEEEVQEEKVEKKSASKRRGGKSSKGKSA